jgi:hypothetical protein
LFAVYGVPRWRPLWATQARANFQNSENTMNEPSKSPEQNSIEAQLAHVDKMRASAPVSRVSRISVDRLYSTGNFEHVKYSLSVEVPEGASAAAALTGIEKIMAALAPESKACCFTRGELDRELNRTIELRKDLLSLSGDEFMRRHGHFEGTPKDYIERCEKMHAENQAKRLAYEHRARKARAILDDLGGAAAWKDAKLDWENDWEDDL